MKGKKKARRSSGRKEVHTCGAQLCPHCGKCHYHGCNNSAHYCQKAIEEFEAAKSQERL